MWGCIARLVFRDVLKDHNAFVFKRRGTPLIHRYITTFKIKNTTAIICYVLESTLSAIYRFYHLKGAKIPETFKEVTMNHRRQKKIIKKNTKYWMNYKESNQQLALTAAQYCCCWNLTWRRVEGTSLIQYAASFPSSKSLTKQGECVTKQEQTMYFYTWYWRAFA